MFNCDKIEVSSKFGGNELKDDLIILNKSIDISRKSHNGQKRITGEDYFNHTHRVANTFYLDNFEKSIAYLHDVVEDTEVTFEDLLNNGISQEIVNQLKLLTHDPSDDYDSYINKILTSKVASIIKLADLLDNLNVSQFTLEQLHKKSTIDRLLKYEKSKSKIIKSLLVNHTSYYYNKIYNKIYNQK